MKDMIELAGGTFRMGSERFYPEEAPVREVTVDGFAIDRHPVTVAEFRRFVKDTGHVTSAEQPPDPEHYPDADPDLLVPGSLVFEPTAGPVPLDDYRNWWTWRPGADWRHPEGPGSTVGGRERHPVTHVTHADAAAYAEWAGKSLPTEAEWEYAARGGLDGAIFTWGDEFAPKGRMMANTWQGEFPWQNLLHDRYERTSPVETFPPNGYGLYDMAGNVWEWTDDWFTRPGTQHTCCAPGDPEHRFPRRVMMGGSHLCAPNYCLRYRPAARQGEAVDTSTSHIGFRCVVREG
jgi:formylglycine-generating enzyme required for sulfatase activity